MQRFLPANATVVNEISSTSVDFVGNYVLITSGSATVILGVTVLLLLRKRPCKRADHILIEGYAVAALLSATGRVLLAVNRLQQCQLDACFIKPFYCLLRPHFMLSSIANGSTFTLIFLLSLERVLYFNGNLWHEKLFSSRRTKLLVLVSFIPGALDYAASLTVAIYKSNKLISPMCYRLEVIGTLLYLIDVFWCTSLLFFTLAGYVLSYVYLVRSRLRQTEYDSKQGSTTKAPSFSRNLCRLSCSALA
ncbi:hypothetical protein M514_04325 [Trichuris suis]|uniref:G-protein coupled receptors family 1 profile domain-containing protein n=1 Tax=Trichuris suis TaxID=68888 RepID=A0A085MX39_9BILA|nr:hypothetical protein M513_04325 [Trichuris suis]KFD61785.1 hypothetical protein M514_04325 [Trichuris suis]